MKIEKRKISELIRAEYNPRKISVVQLYELKEGIEEFGLVQPLVVNENPERKNVIVGGHQRLKIWEELGNKEVDCSIVNLPLDKERKLNIKLNKNGGTFDDDLLKEFFDYEELIEWGFTVSELFDMDETEIKGNIEDDEIPEVKESKVKRGDIWKLGEHRIMCGDSTSKEAVEILMDGEKADMVFTDPPYGMFLDADYSAMKNNLDFAKSKGFKGGKKYKNVIGDHEDFNPDFINNVFNCFSYCKEIFLWGADYYSEFLIDKNQGSWVVWDKRANNNNDIKADESSDKMYGSCFELCWSKNKHKRDIARVKWAGVFGTEQEFDRKRHHPTQKPSLLVEWFFNKWGKENDLIADLYLGSGSTLIAAEKLNRKCYGMELDEKYCDVIIERWEQFTGNKAEKING